MQLKPFTEMFDGKIEGHEIKIFHKASNFSVLVKPVDSNDDLLSSFEMVMNEFFKEDQLFLITHLARLRKKPLNLKVECIESAFEELTGGYRREAFH